MERAQLIKAVCGNLDAKDWYAKSFWSIAKRYGDRKYLYCRVLAATSPLKSVKNNAILADRILTLLDFSSPFEAHDQNLKRIKNGQALSGLKVHHFFRALIGDQNAVTIDQHMFDLFEVKPNKNLYNVIVDIIRSVAKDLDMEPRQVQSCLWAYQKRLKGQQVFDFSDFIGKL